jgi:spermidine/putrescine transport system substrate-binding protein
MLKKLQVTLICLTILLGLNGCNAVVTPAPGFTPTPPSLAEELIVYDWTEDKIQTVFEAFTKEYGVKVTYLVYKTQEEAIANMKAGQTYDVVVMDNQFIPSLVVEGLLAEIDFRNVPNFKHISPNFRDLTYDPNNKHTIPYSWGTTGLIVRSDLVDEPITHWADLWDPRYAGRVLQWESTPRYTLGAALKSLDYSANSENPAELEAALERLLELKSSAIWLNGELTSTPKLVSGEAVMALGWSEDLWLAQAENEHVTYVLPEEGTLLWGDNFIIPANSPHKYSAELFLNFILRPEISAQIIEGNYYPMANQAALPFIEPKILNDPVVYPSNEQMKNAELLLPLSAKGEKLHADIWTRFLAAAP